QPAHRPRPGHPTGAGDRLLMETRQQLNALVTAATRDLLRQEAQARKCAQGDLVEAALLAYLQPGASPETEGLVFARLLAIEETLAQVLGTLQALVTLAERQVKKPEPPKVATYDEMYGEPEKGPSLPDVAPADPLPALPPPRGWRGLFRGKEAR